MQQRPARILLLEDDPAIADTVVFALRREGYEVSHATLVREAAALVSSERPAAAVLDVGLPDGNGLDLARAWRHDADAALARLPMLVLSARGEEIDRVLGLEAGADDYLAKPFSPRELVARVRALLRRAAMPAAAEGAPHEAGNAAAGAADTPSSLQLDAPGQRVLCGGTALALTRLEYRLLRELLLARGRILSREVLFERIWGLQAQAADRTVDTHMKTLRAKLREAGAGAEVIVTHRGLGYALGDLPAGAATPRGP